MVGVLHRRGAPDPFFLDVRARYTALETDAVALRTFDVGGPARTAADPAYTRAVLSAQLPHHSAQEIEQLVELRVRRQERLHTR